MNKAIAFWELNATFTLGHPPTIFGDKQNLAGQTIPYRPVLTQNCCIPFLIPLCHQETAVWGAWPTSASALRLSHWWLVCLTLIVWCVFMSNDCRDLYLLCSMKSCQIYDLWCCVACIKNYVSELHNLYQIPITAGWGLICASTFPASGAPFANRRFPAGNFCQDHGWTLVNDHGSMTMGQSNMFDMWRNSQLNMCNHRMCFNRISSHSRP